MMCPKIVILGKISNGKYKVTFPYSPIFTDFETDCDRVNVNDEVYILNPSHNEVAEIMFNRLKPRINEADIILVYGEIGEHTQKDINYAISKEKEIIYLAIKHKKELT